MKRPAPISVVDLFAGPGGLGEGFSALKYGNAFRILVSAEMNKAAHQTLRLRAFFRQLMRNGEASLASYYHYCNNQAEHPWDASNFDAWRESALEARQITLGSPEGNSELGSVLTSARLGPDAPWVLIGGPPCQAYSLVGRARNRGKADYRAEDDHRHYLYREYLKIIQKYRPAVFVMENVKGMLSSRVDGQRIFHTILKDLADPDRAMGIASGSGYRIHSLSSLSAFDRSMSPEDIDPHQFIIKAEDYGIPQARHRVILLGVRDDIALIPEMLGKIETSSVQEALRGLPRLRSRISRNTDSSNLWEEAVRQHLDELKVEAASLPHLSKLVESLTKAASGLSGEVGFGSLRLPRRSSDFIPKSNLDHWFHDERLSVWLNEETRGHMTSDLRRYLYAAAFADAFGRSPKGHQEFALSGLAPAHLNWESGKFSDRFRVQQYNRPSSTVTSHISKDGHAFIHPEAAQCRSLTVREAARLQTFPDNYFFQGNRTEQFHQVGNAVPPLLAIQIARIVEKVLALNS